MEQVTGFRLNWMLARALQLTTVALLLVVPAAFGQTTLPVFDADVVSLRTEHLSMRCKVDLYTSTPFSALSFTNSPDGFTANYRVNVQVKDSDGEDALLVDNPVWDRTVRVPNFAETTSRERFDRTTHTIELDPGSYVFTFQVEDLKTGESFLRQRRVNVRDMNKPLAVSDILLLSEFDAEVNTMEPLVTDEVTSDQLGLMLFYEAYLSGPQNAVLRHEVFPLRSLQAEGHTGKQDPVYEDAAEKYLDAGRTQHVVRIPFDKLEVGPHVVRITVIDESGAVATSERMFTVIWSGLAAHLQDLDEAVLQLQYIADKKEIRHIRDGQTDAEKWQRFREFWQRRDPTPGTLRNEKMEEYYYRVSYANRRYGALEDGWRTDRGHVMVLFGEPDHVERHPFAFNSNPYELWYYYRIGKRFIFVDRTGLGDFQLHVPIWSDRNRIP